MREEPLLVIFEGKPAPASGTLLKPCGFKILVCWQSIIYGFLIFY